MPVARIAESIRIAREYDRYRREREVATQAKALTSAGGGDWFIHNTMNVSGQVILEARGSNNQRLDFAGIGYAGGTGEHLVTEYQKAKRLLEEIDLDSEEAKALLNILRVTPADQIKPNMKASELVRQWLSPEEWIQLQQEHYVTIKSKKYPGRKYIVWENPSRRVEVFDENNARIAECCGIVSSYRSYGQSSGNFAEGDKLLTKIMAIKEDEDYYLAHSNITHYGEKSRHLFPEAPRPEPIIYPGSQRHRRRVELHADRTLNYPGREQTTAEINADADATLLGMGLMGSTLAAMAAGGTGAYLMSRMFEKDKHKRNKAKASVLKRLHNCTKHLRTKRR